MRHGIGKHYKDLDYYNGGFKAGLRDDRGFIAHSYQEYFHGKFFKNQKRGFGYTIPFDMKSYSMGMWKSDMEVKES